MIRELASAIPLSNCENFISVAAEASNCFGFRDGDSSSIHSLSSKWSRYEKDKAKRIAARRRAVLRVESQIAEHPRRLEELCTRRVEETDRMKAVASELSNLYKVMVVLSCGRVCKGLSLRESHEISTIYGGHKSGYKVLLVVVLVLKIKVVAPPEKKSLSR